MNQFSVIPPRALKPVSLVSLCILMAFNPVQAQEVEDDEETLQPIVVTASRIQQLQKDAIPHTTVITSEMIREKRVTDVPSLLRSEAGISVASSGGYGKQTSVFMRGANSNQILVLIDGIPVRDSTGTTSNPIELQHLMPDQIDRIEIVRGNVSAIYGSGAIGGVIQIFTKRGEGPASVTLSAEAGSKQTSKLSANIAGKTEGTRYALGATRLYTKGFSAINTNKRNNNPDKDSDRNININAAVSHEWSPGNEVGLNLFAFNSRYEFDSEATAADYDYGKSREWTLSAFSKNRLTENWQSKLTFSHTKIKRDTFYQGVFSNYHYPYVSDASLLQWVNEIALSPNWIMTLGTDLSHEKADFNETSRDFSRNNQSFFAGLNGVMGSHHFQLNGRYDHVKGSGSDVTGYLGYGYDITSSWKVLASASTAFLAPTLYQLYSPYGNSLNAERSRSYEAGLQYANKLTLIRGTFFDTRTHDVIGFESFLTPPYGQYVNEGKVRTRGFELSAASRLYDWDLRGSFTWQNPENLRTNSWQLKRPRQMASLDVSRKFGAWHIGGDINYQSHRLDTYSGDTVRLASYALVNMNTSYEITKEVSVFARIENLLDRRYESVYGYNQPSRGFFTGLNLKL